MAADVRRESIKTLLLVMAATYQRDLLPRVAVPSLLIGPLRTYAFEVGVNEETELVLPPAGGAPVGSDAGRSTSTGPRAAARLGGAAALRCVGERTSQSPVARPHRHTGTRHGAGRQVAPTAR